ncbi:MAG: tetratricopeptide repeat protein [Deltaproteobacteria bacterium]|nr:tetratricopeptide repeat protein [Deltaproteobacteria bacterium]
MKFQTQRLQRLTAVLIAVLVICYPNLEINASSFLKAVNRLDMSQVRSFDEMNAAVELLANSLTAAIEEKKATFSFQKLILTKSGECAGKLVSLHKNTSKITAAAKQEKNIFLMNRDVIKRILALNEKIIWNFQENALDKMEDPSAFFKSHEWQDPQYLISLSSYWLGWNGYYGSLLFSENDPMKNLMLDEAIKGFSRAFIDFKEDSIIARSLFGRGLCYRQMKEYEKALHDLKSVKGKIRKDDLLYLRCVYEESRISYQTGNFGTALRSLDEIQEDFPKEKISKEITVGLNRLRFKVLVALLEKQEAESRKGRKTLGQHNQRIFNELKPLAINPDGVAEFYRYTQENADRLEDLSYADLGPVASIAIGDLFFDQKNYDKALHYYLPLHADFPSFLIDRMDGVWFRTAYIYCKKEQWNKAIPFLDDFHKKFPDSFLIKQAVPLYYVAAANNYKGNTTERTYRKYIDSIKVYLIRCSGTCPDLSEAHFTLGMHYQKSGKNSLAVTEYSRVNEDSPNYFKAKYYVLQSYIEKLDSLEKREQGQSKAAVKIYHDGIGLLKSCQSVRLKQKETVGQTEIAPHMAILKANLLTFGPDGACRESVKTLKGFENRFPLQKKLFLQAVYLRTVCYHRLGMLTEAEEEIDRFIAVSPVDSDRYAVLRNLADKFNHEAEKLQSKGEKTAAGRYWETALMIYRKLYKISCEHPQYNQYCDLAQLSMAEIYINKDQLDKAEALYQDILKKNSLSADAVYSLGLLYEKKGQWKDALMIWRRFSDGVKAGTYHWFESRYRTALALTRIGENSKACDVLTITLVLHPDFGNDELKEKYLDLKSEICKAEQ